MHEKKYSLYTEWYLKRKIDLYFDFIFIIVLIYKILRMYKNLFFILIIQYKTHFANNSYII